jgi:hypothetical protein
MISRPPPPFPLYQGHQLAAKTLPLSSDTPLSPAQWVAQNLAFQPDPVQTQILDHPAHRLILNCTRQWGKTTVCAAKALHFALNHPASILLPNLAQILSLPGHADGIRGFTAGLLDAPLSPSHHSLLGDKPLCR